MTKVPAVRIAPWLKASGIAAAVLAGLAGCSSLDNGLNKSDYRALAERTPPGPPPGSQAAAEPPIPEMQPILAAPPPPALEQRLVTVNVPDPDVPLRDVLVELARKVGVDLDLDPKISGGIILYAKDRPFVEVIDRICEMANLRYAFKNNVLRIELDTMVNHDYRLDVLNSVRKAKTEVATSTDVFAAVSGGGATGGSNNSTSDVSSETTNDPWKEVSDNLTQILTNSNPSAQPIQSNVVGSGAEQRAMVAPTATAPGAGAQRSAAGSGGGAAPNTAAGGGQPGAVTPPIPAPGTPAQVGAPATAPAVGGGNSTSNQAADTTGDTGNPAPPPAPAAGTTTTTTTTTPPAANPLAAAQQAILSQALGGTSPAPATAAASGGPAAAAPSAPKAFFSINRTAGIVSVFGTSHQHKLVRDYLNRVIAETGAQVLIEAKVVEVDLNDGYKAGIDWQKAINLAGQSFSVGTLQGPAGQGLLADQNNFAALPLAAATENPFTLAWTGRDFSTLLQFVQGFGTTRTLSSSRITALNNQTAVLKVAQNQVYFSLTATITPSTVAGVAGTATYTSQLHTVPIGVTMTVQPIIDPEKDLVTLSLRPTVSVHAGDAADPAVGLALAAACVTSTVGACSPTSIATSVANSNVPIVEIREMDSVVTVPSGEIVIMGGMMQSNTKKQDTGVPGAADIPLIGNLFKAQTSETDVTELVIFLKASIVHGNDSIDWADKDLYKRYIQDPRPLAF